MKGITQLQVHSLEGRIGTELIKSGLSLEETQRFLGGRKDPINTLTHDVTHLIISRVRGLYVGPNEESFTLYERQINHDRSIEDLVQAVKHAGWSVRDNYICNAGHVNFDGKLKRKGIHTADLTISRCRSKSGAKPALWRDDINKLKDDQLLAFDLAELIEFIPYRDELLQHGVYQINALGSRFCGLMGREDRSVACILPKTCELELQPVKKASWPCRRHWVPEDWFGICN
ncbi:MAG: hypothetical protein ACYC57_08185 [Thermoleophilia bacterium]